MAGPWKELLSLPYVLGPFCRFEKCPWEMWSNLSNEQILFEVGSVHNTMKWNEIDIKSKRSKMLMWLKVHEDGFKSVNCLEWQSMVASVWKRLMLTCWSYWKKDLRLVGTTFSDNGWNLSLIMGLYRGQCNTKPHFQLHYRINSGIVSRDRDNPSSIIHHKKSCP